MNISDFIVSFIKEGNDVELPGIGTLTGKEIAAHHDAATGTYYPARRTVAFSRGTVGDKSIIHGIAEKECVTDEIAEQMWKNYIDALSDKLKRNPQGHTFNGMGTLVAAEAGAVFTPIEGLDLDADKRREQPIEHVNLYTPKEQEDPFAQFEKPAAEAPVFQPTPTPEEIAAEKAREEQEKAEREAAELARREAEERAKREAEEKAKREAEEKARREAEEKAKREAEEQARREAATAAAMAASQSVASEATGVGETPLQPAAAKKARRRPWLVVLLVLLALLIAGGAYYYFAIYRPAHAVAQEGEHIQLPPYSRFSRSIGLVKYEEDDIFRTEEELHAYMSDYIHAYLSARHYNNCYAIFMKAVDDYADQRLHELMTDDHFAVQRFTPFNDYYYNFCYDELEVQGCYYNRCKVQGELFDIDMLDRFLDKLIAELGLHPDGNMGGAAGYGAAHHAGANRNGANAKDAALVAPEPQAPMLKNSKMGFDIIAGFFTQKSTANRMANNLKSLGCDAYIINRSGLYYVSMGSAGSYTAAEDLCKHIKSWYKGDVKVKNWNE